MTGARSPLGIGVLLPISLMALTPPCLAAEADVPAALVVLDGSRSMWAEIGGVSKIAIAKASLTKIIPSYDGKLALGLVTFGHRSSSSCDDAEILAAPGKLDGKSHEALLEKLKPKGSAPIASAITEAVKAGSASRLDLVLIVDGPDSCKGDPCAAAENAKASHKDLRIHTIALDTKIEEKHTALSCVAEKTGGKFLTAINAAEFDHAMAMVFAEIAAPEAPGSGDVPVAVATPPLDAGDVGMDLTGALAVKGFATTAPGLSHSLPGADITGALPEINLGETAVAPLIAEQPVADLSRAAPPAAETEGVVTTMAFATEEPKAPPGPPPPPVPVTFKALLTEGGPALRSGLIWRIYSSRADGHTLLATHREPNPTTPLTPGEYLVNAAYGLSNLTKKIKVEKGKSLEEAFVLNTGGLRLSAILANSQNLPPSAVTFDIYSDEEDQFGNRQKILGDAPPGLIIRLNAGAYHVVSQFGDANAAVRADVTVEPGKITEATMKHAAGKVTFRLVQTPGGEALADTKWTILTPRGEVVKENAGALPTHILAAGKYSVVAAYGGESYSREFTVETGDTKQIEVVTEDGPISAEALRALTNPPPPPSPTDAPVVAGSGSGESSDTGTAFAPSSPPKIDLGPSLFNPGSLLPN